MKLLYSKLIMKKNNKKIIYLAIIVIVIIIVFWNKINLYIETVNVVDTKTTDKTIVTPVLDTVFDPNKNIIYCSTFQMAWNSLYSDVIKETIEIENKPWYLDKLNELVNLPPQISSDAYVSLAGFGKDNIIEKINNELKNKFNAVPGIIEFPDIEKDDILTFSYLKKVLDFKEKFGTFYSDIRFNDKTTKVKSFGFEQVSSTDNDHGLKSQIKLLYYCEEDFIIELITTSPYDSIILSTIKPKNTLLSTYNNIKTLINGSSEHESKLIYTLVVPKINFDIEQHYNDSVNKHFKNKNFEHFFIKDNIQRIIFKLNENGARLESFSIISVCGSGTPFILRVAGPFTLFFKNKDSIYPYFMAYFGNDELLEKAPPALF